MSKTKPHENPLVSNKKLKQIYTVMAEARVLDEHIVRQQRKSRKRRLESILGQEACRVSTAIDLVVGDLVSDTQDGVAMNLMTGARIGSVLRQLNGILSGTKRQQAESGRQGSAAQQLAWVEDAGDRLRMVLGAAMAFRALRRPNLVMAYVHSRAVPDGAWRHLLGIASKFELPVIFVVLPEAGSKSGRNVSAKALACGVPAFPVDANDAVALYRVAQESIGRTRGDGGPVVIECMTHRLSDERQGLDDPIAQMRSFMLGRKVASKAWLDGVGPGFNRRIEIEQRKITRPAKR